MVRHNLKPGDPVIFRMTKTSTCPGPRARSIFAQRRGETYTYQVDKFWVVAESDDDNMLVLRTRRGKNHQVEANHPHLRRATWWEWLLYRNRFPQLSESSTS